MNTQFVLTPQTAHRTRAVVQSALWAAAGDALGWMTELSRDEGSVANRTGVSFVREPTEWLRRIGGRAGVVIPLPAGTYSDDTQLRLSVCRAIRGDGVFDVEPFAKIELPVWTNYALGAGKGTKAAATNLAKRSANWFSNFFHTRDQSYVRCGGNGAAMRVQPHVWASRPTSDACLLNVLRDALVTHGHVHGFFGAYFHALCLRHVLDNRRVPAPDDLEVFVMRFAEVPRIILQDPHLSEFWRASWEAQTKSTLIEQTSKILEETRNDLYRAKEAAEKRGPRSYRRVLEVLRCFEPAFRGSGIKTAMAASLLAWLHEGDPEGALVAAANELNSDTDTIATMAGAIIGAVASDVPKWRIQDAGYIASEASRLARVAEGAAADGFTYPDLSKWNPPTKQFDAIGKWNGGLALAGVGEVKPMGEQYRSPDAVWQWMQLGFGQTVLVKRRPTVTKIIKEAQMPGDRHSQRPSTTTVGPPQNQGRLPLDARDLKVGGDERRSGRHQDVPRMATGYANLDEATEEVIRSNFDERVIGKVLLKLLDQQNSIEAAVAFTAILSKARLARRRRGL